MDCAKLYNEVKNEIIKSGKSNIFHTKIRNFNGDSSISKEFLSKDIEVYEVSWDMCDCDESLQKHLYSFLDRGVIKIINIPKIPSEYNLTGKMKFYGLDSEDDSVGIPHFYQFAAENEVIISSSFRLLIRYVVNTYNLKIQNHIVWGTNIEYELGNILKDWDITHLSTNVKWAKGGLKKFELTYDPGELGWGGPEDIKGHFKCWDTMTHWKLGVKDMGNILTSYFNFDFNKLDSDFYSFKYSAMDAIVSRAYACVQKRYYDEKGIALKFTPGATALTYYMNGFSPNGNKLCKHRLFDTHTPDELKWVIEALRGGRTEVFSLKEYRGKIGYFDINSAYPFSMKYFKSYPHPSKHHWENKPFMIQKKIEQGYEGVIECVVDTSTVNDFVKHIPYLGTKDPKTGRYIFPLGSWKGKYSVFEIKKAIALGYQFKYEKALLYEPSDNQPFADYVDLCYAIRDEGSKKDDKILRDIGKALGNNLYGKFGQRVLFSQLDDPAAYKPEDIEDCVRIGKSVLVQKDEGFAPHTNGIWSVYITAVCRDLLYNHILNAYTNGNEVIYCDTDSIFVYGGKAPESHQTKLGALKHEADLSYFKAHLPKQYEYEVEGKMTYKAKGVPKNQRQAFLLKGQVEYRKPMKIREAMRRKKFNSKDAHLKLERGIKSINAWVTVTKELKGEYTKRTTLKDGSTVPLILTAK
jgi:hypothetical protein